MSEPLYVVICPQELGTEDGWTERILLTTSSGYAKDMACTVTGGTYHEVTIGAALPTP